MRIRHVINTVGESARDDLLEAQELTLATMDEAMRSSSPELEVEVVAMRFVDEGLPAPWLRDDWLLTQSVLDLGTFSPKRRLPLLRDLLTPFKDSDYDLGVLTNIDIHLQPHFYDLLAEIHRSGYDAFTINRRTVHPPFGRNGSAWLYAQTGTPHPGHDCFVFTPDVIAQAEVDDLCVGATMVGRGLLYNLYLEAERFRQFVDLNATFHVGDDLTWRRVDHDDYTAHNARALSRVITKLIERFGEPAIRRLPGAPLDISRTLRGEPDMWRGPRNRRLAPCRPHSFDRRRLLFAASPGRSGTQYVAQLLDTAPTTVAFHEEEPTMTGPFLRSIAYGDPANSYEHRKVKADVIMSTLKELPGDAVFVETSHMFVKTFADVILDAFNHDRITIIQLHRPLPSLLASMAELGWFTGHAPAWRDWLIPPTAPGSRFSIAHDQITGRLDSAIGYVLDSIIRARELRWSTPNVEWVDIHIDALRNRREKVESLFSTLRLKPGPETWERALQTVNQRRTSKSRRGVGLSREAIDEHIESFVARFETEIRSNGVEHVFAMEV